MSLPGMSLPGRDSLLVSMEWCGMRWRGVCRAAGQGKTDRLRRWWPGNSSHRPGPSIVQSARLPFRRSSSPSGRQFVDRPVRQAAGRPAGPRVRQPAERPAVLIVQHTAGRPAQSGVRSLGRRGTGARGLFRRAAFPRRRRAERADGREPGSAPPPRGGPRARSRSSAGRGCSLLSYDNHVYDRYSQENTNKAQKKVTHCLA